MTRTHYLENSSHQQCAMQFKLSNAICLEEFARCWDQHGTIETDNFAQSDSKLAVHPLLWHYMPVQVPVLVEVARKNIYWCGFDNIN